MSRASGTAAGKKRRGTEGPSVLIGQVADWLMGQALGETDYEPLIGGCCERLLAAGIPLWRAHLTFRILHPLYESMGVTWLRGEGVTIHRYPHRFDGEDFPEQFRVNPFYHMIKARTPQLRRRLTGPEALLDFPVLAEFRAQGASDYLAFLLSFGPEELDGVVGSWVTDRRGGFSDEQVRALLPAQRGLAVACKMRMKEEIAQNVVATYLGPDAGLRVLKGQIRRGDGESLRAVIWYSDLRGSTAIADRLPRDAYIQALNDYFECTGGPVLRHGGQILNFIGDAVLAIFPVGRGVTAKRACARALKACSEARENAARVNRGRQERGEDPLSFGLALHLGDVLFGNIGVPERLTFSVIGPTVNEVARLEALTKTLKRTVVASESFAKHADAAWEDLGRRRVQGVGAGLEVFGLKADA